MSFEKYGVRMERKSESSNDDPSTKSRPTLDLLKDPALNAQGELLWRVSLPLLAINLAMLAIPLGAVNPRLGRSGDVVIALLVALFYLNMVNLAKAWVNNGRADIFVALLALHGTVLALTAILMFFRMRLRAPKAAAA